LNAPTQPRSRRQKIVLCLGLTLAVVAFVLSLLLPSDVKFRLHTQGALHPWLHLAVFSALGALVMLSTSTTRTRVSFLAGAMFLGLSIEYAEAARFHSAFEPYDVMTDTCGVLLGALVGWLITRKRS
jgi:ornithine carbamoyltransferase